MALRRLKFRLYKAADDIINRIEKLLFDENFRDMENEKYRLSARVAELEEMVEILGERRN